MRLHDEDQITRPAPPRPAPFGSPGSGPSGFVRLPGTYPPQEDTSLLIRTLRDRGLARGRTVLDLCTGTGALAVAAAASGASAVTAIDLSRRAVASARINSALRGAGVEVLRGDLFGPVAGRRFDLVISNPPYVPAADDRLPRHRMGRCWDGGRDGRTLVDRICDEVDSVLAPGGTFLITHSAVIGADETVRRLRARGLRSQVVASERIPFGPVMTARAELLSERGLVERDERHEQLVVIEAALPLASIRSVTPAPVDVDVRGRESVPDVLAG